MKKLLALSLGLGLLLVACGGGDDSNEASDSSSAFCKASLEFLEVQASGNPTDPEGQKQLFAKIESASKKVADTAPEEIKADAETIATTMPKIRQTLESVDYDVAKLTPEQQQELQDETFLQAFQSVMTYMTDNCPEVQERLQGPDTSEPPATDTTAPPTTTE